MPCRIVHCTSAPFILGNLDLHTQQPWLLRHVQSLCLFEAVGVRADHPQACYFESVLRCS